MRLYVVNDRRVWLVDTAFQYNAAALVLASKGISKQGLIAQDPPSFCRIQLSIFVGFFCPPLIHVAPPHKNLLDLAGGAKPFNASAADKDSIRSNIFTQLARCQFGLGITFVKLRCDSLPQFAI